MELERLKEKTIDGYGLNVSREEALVIIKSLTSQLLCGVNVGREEWSIKGAEYFSIFVDDPKVPSDEYWESQKPLVEKYLPCEICPSYLEKRVCQALSTRTKTVEVPDLSHPPCKEFFTGEGK